jgi:hypothetical protein
MRPLTDVRILDLSRLIPGPFATLVLADLGATVDKIEDMSGGDYLRHMPPSLGGQSAAFQLLNRGKRSARRSSGSSRRTTCCSISSGPASSAASGSATTSCGSITSA